jgi:hypothetical protein
MRNFFTKRPTSSKSGVVDRFGPDGESFVFLLHGDTAIYCIPNDASYRAKYANSSALGLTQVGDHLSFSADVNGIVNRDDLRNHTLELRLSQAPRPLAGPAVAQLKGA